MFKVYLNDKLMGSFKIDMDAALLATNLTVSGTLNDNIEVYGPKSDYIHFIEGNKK